VLRDTGIEVAEAGVMHGAVVLPRVPGLSVVRCLGRGGMGAVFLARTRRGHDVALKVIATDGEPTPDAVVRFHREIAALSTLRHPHIVRLFDAGSVDGRPYIVLELIAGRPLARLRPRTRATAVDLAWQLGRAIAAVHAAGWIHRDIKLGNAIVGPYGFLTLIDFGLAKHVDDPEHDGDDSIVTLFADPPDVTACGTVVGTPRYLAPEVRAGQPARPASDVYGLGLVLQDMLRVVQERAGIDLTALIDRMTRADPEVRPSAAAVVRQLEPLLGDELLIYDDTAFDGATWPLSADTSAMAHEQAALDDQRESE
jgi:serine/threonine-protein kinase